MQIFRRAWPAFAILTFALAAAAPTPCAAAAPLTAHATPQSATTSRGTASLVDKVRSATDRFRDINVAISEGWVQATPCVSGPDFGAMGVHFVLPSRLGDGVLNAEQPEALIYEPLASGAFRLVGVEFIVFAAAWAAQNPNGGPPSLDGNLLNFVAAPNRFGLADFYELHVWAWEHNPNGSFADWNVAVTCEQQRVN